MKQILFTFIATFVYASTLLATDIITDTVKLQELERYNKVLQDPTLTIRGAIETQESYFLKIEAKSSRRSRLLKAVLNKHSGELYMGTAYDKEGNSITFPVDADIVKAGIAFSYGKGDKEIYVVTDPECYHCTKFAKKSFDKLDDYTVHVIFFPPSSRKSAPAMVEWIMRAEDDAGKKERLKEIVFDGSKAYTALIKDSKKPFVYSEAVAKRIKKMDKAVLELATKVTPSIYNADFERLSQKSIFKKYVPKDSKENAKK